MNEFPKTVLSRSSLRLALLVATLAACSQSTEPGDDSIPVRYDLGGSTVPVLAASAERLYVLRPVSAQTQFLEARRLNGQAIWSVSAPSCGDDCVIAVDSADNIYSNVAAGVTSRDSNGNLRWTSPTGRISSIALGSNERLYVASLPFAVPQRVHSLDAVTGSVRWITSLLPGLDATALVLDDSRAIVYALGRGRATAINAETGGIRWTTGNTCFGGTQGAIASDGTIYITCDNQSTSRLFASNPDGSLRWVVTIGSGTEGTMAPVVDAAGTIYVANSTSVTAVTPGGAISWQLTGLLNNNVNPAVASNGDVYVHALQSLSAERGVLVVNSGTVIEDKGPLGCSGSFLLAPQGRVYCGIAGGIAAFQGGSTDVTGQWSQFSRDALRSSRKR